MSTDINLVFFRLLRSAINSVPLTAEERAEYSSELFQSYINIAKKHDVTHLFILGLKNNGLLSEENVAYEKILLKAALRYERQNYEYNKLCSALEEAKIPFIPLKGSVIRKFYPEPWMRTSCDIDVLVNKEDLSSAIEYLSEKLGYNETDRSAHDVTLITPQNVRIELHFDLIEEEYANGTNYALSHVWDSVSPVPSHTYMMEMSDPFFYFYHIAHMAKHFENGGCGIRPFLDLWILNSLSEFDETKRYKVLSDNGLDQFANVARSLSNVWFGNEAHSELTKKVQEYIISGGVYGSTQNKVAVNQKKHGGKLGYLFGRMFVPLSRLRRYYPILDKYPILMPIMQVRRWFMLANPKIASMAKNELKANRNLDKNITAELNKLMDDIGLHGKTT